MFRFLGWVWRLPCPFVGKPPFYRKLEPNCCIPQSIPTIGGRCRQRLIQIGSLRA
jgi:hypothetical protein